MYFRGKTNCKGPFKNNKYCSVIDGRATVLSSINFQGIITELNSKLIVIMEYF